MLAQVDSGTFAPPPFEGSSTASAKRPKLATSTSTQICSTDEGQSGTAAQSLFNAACVGDENNGVDKRTPSTSTDAVQSGTVAQSLFIASSVGNKREPTRQQNHAEDSSSRSDAGLSSRCLEHTQYKRQHNGCNPSSDSCGHESSVLPSSMKRFLMARDARNLDAKRHKSLDDGPSQATE